MLLSEMIRRCARSYGDRLAYVDGERARTWAQMDERSDRLAAVLQACGIGRGDVAVILSQDRLEVVEHWFACLKVGAIRVGANYRYAPSEVAHVIRDSGAKCVMVEAACTNLLQDAEPYFAIQGTLVIGFGGEHGRDVDMEQAMAAAAPQPVSIGEHDPVAIAYTAGSTGLPKGVVWTNAGMREGMKWLVLNAGLTPEDRWLNPSPVAAGPLLFATMNMVNGMTALLPDGRFEPKRFASTVARHQVTATQLVPTMLQDVIEELKARPQDTSSLRLVCYGSMPASPALIKAAKDLFRCEIQQWYGSTEMTGIVSMLKDSDHRKALAEQPELLMSCGRPMPHAQIEIRAEDGATTLPAAEAGEVWVRSETLFAGYHERPEETRAALVDGWFRPGDIGKISPEGYLYLLDRKNFMIISGGYNVYPSVVEATLAEIDGVLEVAVVGAPHPRWGEAVTATIALKAGAQVTEKDVQAFARERLAKWEQPKHIEFVAGLPRGATGKVDRRSIRDQFRAQPEQLTWNR